MQREVERWITVNGKHIPIYADESDDSQKKERQIKQNEEEAQKKNTKMLYGVPVDGNNAMPDKHVDGVSSTDWIMHTIDCDEKTADAIREAISAWSDYGSSDIHKESEETNYYSKSGKERARLIDKYLNSSAVPKYKGELYRGLRVKQDLDGASCKSIDDMIKSGVWKELGITGFSYDKEQAELYAMPDSLSNKVMVILRNNKHASTIGHLSIGGGEKEALYPSSIKNGIKIVEWEKKPIYVEVLDRKHFRETGERRNKQKLVHYEYTIVLDDSEE